MAEQLLHVAHVRATLDEVRREAVAQHMRRDAGGNAGRLRALPDEALDSAGRESAPADIQTKQEDLRPSPRRHQRRARAAGPGGRPCPYPYPYPKNDGRTARPVPMVRAERAQAVTRRPRLPFRWVAYSHQPHEVARHLSCLAQERSAQSTRGDRAHRVRPV
jgi:hypothetical protein